MQPLFCELVPYLLAKGQTLTCHNKSWYDRNMSSPRGPSYDATSALRTARHKMISEVASRRSPRSRMHGGLIKLCFIFLFIRLAKDQHKSTATVSILILLQSYLGFLKVVFSPCGGHGRAEANYCQPSEFSRSSATFPTTQVGFQATTNGPRSCAFVSVRQ